MAYENPGMQDVVLHLPTALRDRVEEMASRECISLNLFVLMAVAEKLQRLQLQQTLELSEKDDLKRDGTNNSPFLVH